MKRPTFLVAVLLTIGGCASPPRPDRVLEVGALNTDAAGRRSMDALAAAAVDATRRLLDGTPGTAPRVWDQDVAIPVFKEIIDSSLEHDRQLEQTETNWLMHQRGNQ